MSVHPAVSHLMTPTPRLRLAAMVCCALLACPAAAQSQGPTLPTPSRQMGAPTGGTTFQHAIFGNPRSSNEGNHTRVVFDLALGVTYALIPTVDGLRIDVAGAEILAPVRTALGISVVDQRVSGTQVSLITPFALTRTTGWRASEATLASGIRVLILDLGPDVLGGAGENLRGLITRLSGAPQGLAISASVAGTGTPGGVTPSDMLSATSGVTPPAAPPPLPGGVPGQVSALSGQAQGRIQPGALLPAPRIGKNPGLTRVVLELPPGAAYRMLPSSLGLRVELTGVSAAPLEAQAISPELQAWRYEPGTDGLTVTLLTGTPVTNRSGWRAQLVLPLPGTDRSRLAIDLSPSLADLTPLTPRERVLAAVPATPVARGTAMLALGAALVKPRAVIDPGHGGRDSGGIGAVIEKQVALEVALRVRDLLSKAGVDVIMTRDTDRALVPDKATDLRMRAELASPGTQVFVSIHVNALPAASALRGYGVETWWNPNHPLSSALAALIQNNVTAVTGAFSRGLKNTSSLSVLRNSRIPAALIEIGYTSHPVDGLNLKDTNYLDRVALGIAQGVREALVTGVTAGKER